MLLQFGKKRCGEGAMNTASINAEYAALWLLAGLGS